MIKSNEIVMDMRASKDGTIGMSGDLNKKDGLINVMFQNRYRSDNEPKFELGKPTGYVIADEPKIKIIFDDVETMQCAIDRLVSMKAMLETIKPIKKKVLISDIEITEGFRKSNVQSAKLIKCNTHYIKTGLFDRDIVLDADGVLIDGYVAYVVANMNGLKEVEVLQNK